MVESARKAPRPPFMHSCTRERNATSCESFSAWLGFEEPRYACGKAQARIGVPNTKSAPKGRTESSRKVPCNCVVELGMEDRDHPNEKHVEGASGVDGRREELVVGNPCTRDDRRAEQRDIENRHWVPFSTKIMSPCRSASLTAPASYPRQTNPRGKGLSKRDNSFPFQGEPSRYRDRIHQLEHRDVAHELHHQLAILH